MMAETKALPPPLVKEAINEQLKLSDLVANATAQIVTGPGFTVGSKVELFTEMGSGEHRVSTSVTIIPSVMELLIPKDFFEKYLVSGSRAQIHYTVTPPGQNEVESAALTLTVVR